MQAFDEDMKEALGRQIMEAMNFIRHENKLLEERLLKRVDSEVQKVLGGIEGELAEQHAALRDVQNSISSVSQLNSQMTDLKREIDGIGSLSQMSAASGNRQAPNGEFTTSLRALRNSFDQEHSRHEVETTVLHANLEDVYLRLNALERQSKSQRQKKGAVRPIAAAPPSPQQRQLKRVRSTTNLKRHREALEEVARAYSASILDETCACTEVTPMMVVPEGGPPPVANARSRVSSVRCVRTPEANIKRHNGRGLQQRNRQEGRRNLSQDERRFRSIEAVAKMPFAKIDADSLPTYAPTSSSTSSDTSCEPWPLQVKEHAKTVRNYAIPSINLQNVMQGIISARSSPLSPPLSCGSTFTRESTRDSMSTDDQEVLQSRSTSPQRLPDEEIYGGVQRSRVVPFKSRFSFPGGLYMNVTPTRPQD